MVNRLTSRNDKTSGPVHHTDLNGRSYFGPDPKTLEYTLAVFNGGDVNYTSLVNYYRQRFPAEPIAHLGNEAEDLNSAVIVRYGNATYLSLDGVAPANYPYLSKEVLAELIQALRAAH